MSNANNPADRSELTQLKSQLEDQFGCMEATSTENPPAAPIEDTVVIDNIGLLDNLQEVAQQLDTLAEGPSDTELTESDINVDEQLALMAAGSGDSGIEDQLPLSGDGFDVIEDEPDFTQDVAFQETTTQVPAEPPLTDAQLVVGVFTQLANVLGLIGQYSQPFKPDDILSKAENETREQQQAAKLEELKSYYNDFIAKGWVSPKPLTADQFLQYQRAVRLLWTGIDGIHMEVIYVNQVYNICGMGVVLGEVRDGLVQYLSSGPSNEQDFFLIPGDLEGLGYTLTVID